jgi:hypothetical protein
VGDRQADAGAQVAGGYRRFGRASSFDAARKAADAKLNPEWMDVRGQVHRDRVPGAAGYRGGQRIPRRLRHRAHQHARPRSEPAAELKKATEAFKPVLEKTEKA